MQSSSDPSFGLDHGHPGRPPPQPPRQSANDVAEALHAVRGDHPGVMLDFDGRDLPEPEPEPEPPTAGVSAIPSMQQAQAASSASGAAKPIRRRMRMITSCLECRRRKLKCNKSQPCTNCVKFGRDCVYLGPKLDEASQLRLTEIKEKVGSLERQLERDVAKSTSRPFNQQSILADDVGDDFDGELEITPMVALDLMYDDDADGTDEIIDLGIQVGKMRITERIGGLNRPRISEEISAGLSAGGPPMGPPRGAPVTPMAPLGGKVSDPSGADSSIPDFLRPTGSYIPPTSGFFFGQVVQTPSLLHFLPHKEAGDRLMQRYFTAVHPIARCVHRPTFEVQYAGFWEDVRNCYEPRASVQAVVFAAWFSAAVSLDDATINRDFGFTRASLVENMKIGTESALSKANFLRTTRVETLQAFIMYLVPLCRAEISRAHSVLLGSAIRMAECMGLHRDGEAYGLTPVETHVRRLLWHQLCFLDIRTCEAQGPKPAIRREDYDTKLPINCEEDELTNATVVPASADHWTSTLLPLLRFEINEMMRIIWVDRRKIENRKTTLTAVLSKIEQFRKRMHEKYDRFMDDRVPIQRYAKLVMLLLIYRLHAMVLHPYHANTANPLPPRLNSVLIMSGIMIIEVAIQLETNALFADWAWYIGAYQQFQIALLLATEMYYRPNNKEAERIWCCLDYVFNLDRNMPRETKGLQILSEIMGKTSVYMSMRKMRAPAGIVQAVPDKQAVKPDMQTATAPPPQHPTHPQQSQGVVPGLKAEPGMPPPRMAPNGAMSSASSIQPTMVHQTPQPPPPPPNLWVFAGVSNGESLYTLPQGNVESPENSSDGGSVAGQVQRQHGGPLPATGNVIDNMDLETLNALFPFDPNTGNVSGFVDPTLGTGWHG